MTDNMRGAAFMAGAMAAFTMNDATIKWLALDLPTFQIVALRGVAATAMVAALAWSTGALARPVPRADRPWVALRALLEVAAFVPFVLALTNMPLAAVTAILQALPLTITAAGALFHGERVGPRRWAAIVVGLAGVLLIVRPGAGDFSPWSLAAVATVLIVTARDLVTRRLSPAVPSLQVATVTAAGVAVLGAVLSLREPWTPVGAGQGGAVLFAALFVLAGYVLSILAMRVGEVAAVTPFRYSSMLWGLLLGALVFGETPAPATLVGAALVVGTGLYTVWREGRAPIPRPAAPR